MYIYNENLNLSGNIESMPEVSDLGEIEKHCRKLLGYGADQTQSVLKLIHIM